MFLRQANEAVRAVNRMSRGEVEAALNWGGFATYDSESTQELRTALVLAIEAGDVDLHWLELGGVAA